jgi:translocator protein
MDPVVYDWYEQLKKPAWAPEPPVFGYVWGTLYPILIVTHGFVLWQAWKKKIEWTVALPFLLNLITNLMFTPLQFGLRSNLLALIDVHLVLFTIIWSMLAIWPKYRWVAFAQIPYLIWVFIATTLQWQVFILNR